MVLSWCYTLVLKPAAGHMMHVLKEQVYLVSTVVSG